MARLRSAATRDRVIIVLGLLYVAIRVGVLLHIVLGSSSHAPIGRVTIGPDSRQFIEDARAWPWDHNFWIPHEGPFLYVLLLKLAGRRIRTTIVMQTCLATAMWLVGSNAIANIPSSRWLRRASFVAMLSLGLHPTITIWDGVIGTEALSIGFLTLTFGCAVRITRFGVSTRRILALLGALFGLGVIRDTGPVLLVPVALVLCAYMLRRKDLRGTLLPIVIVAVATSVLSFALVGDRWFNPTVELVVLRMLPDKQFHGDLIDAGLDLKNPHLALPDKGTIYNFGAKLIRIDPKYHDFVRWIERDGRSAYLASLVRHPSYAFFQPFTETTAFISPRVEEYVDLAGGRAPGALRWPGFLVWPSGLLLTLVMFGIAVGASLWCYRRERHGERKYLGRTAVLVLGTAALCVIHFYAVYHGDAAEGHRHAVALAVQIRLVIISAAVLSVSSWRTA